MLYSTLLSKLFSTLSQWLLNNDSIEHEELLAHMTNKEIDGRSKKWNLPKVIELTKNIFALISLLKQQQEKALLNVACFQNCHRRAEEQVLEWPNMEIFLPLVSKSSIEWRTLLSFSSSWVHVQHQHIVVLSTKRNLGGRHLWGRISHL